jgi:hypothetical protein
LSPLQPSSSAGTSLSALLYRRRYFSILCPEVARVPIRMTTTCWWNLDFTLTLILTAREFKKPFFVKMKTSPGWLKKNIFKKSKIPRKKS